MSYCPQDYKPCIDDFCHLGGVCFTTQAPVLDRCWKCHALYNEEEPCECEPWDGEEDAE